MEHIYSVQMLKYSLRRNKVKIIVWALSITVGLAIGGYAGVQVYYNGWLG